MHHLWGTVAAVLTNKASLTVATAGADYFAPPMGDTLTIADASLTLLEKTAPPAFEDPAPVDPEHCWAC